MSIGMINMLDMIKRLIRFVIHGVKVFTLIRNQRHADTDGYLNIALNNMRGFAQRSRLIRNSVTARHIRKVNKEFIPVEPAHQSIFVDNRKNDVRHVDTGRVPDPMTEGIIDMLEVINIKQKYGAAGILLVLSDQTVYMLDEDLTA